MDVFGRVCDFGQNAGILTFSQNARTKCAHSDKISECWHSAFFTGCAHSSLVLSSREAVIAQLGERQTEDLEVLGSIPSPGIIFRIAIYFCAACCRQIQANVRSNGVTVSTLDFESSDGGSNPP